MGIAIALFGLSQAPGLPALGVGFPRGGVADQRHRGQARGRGNLPRARMT